MGGFLPLLHDRNCDCNLFEPNSDTAPVSAITLMPARSTLLPFGLALVFWGIVEGLKKLKLSGAAVAALASLICLLVPVQMASQTWDDHDRSGRYLCRDFGANYLLTLPDKDNPIIFCNGDNDTFPAVVQPGS